MLSFEFTQLNPSMAWKILWQYFMPTRMSCSNLIFTSILIFPNCISSLTMLSLSYCLALQTALTVNFLNDCTSTLPKKRITPVTSAIMKNKWPYGSSARRQSSCVVPTSTGCWNSLSQHQPISLVTADMTQTWTQRWKGQMLTSSLHMVRPCSSQPLSCFCATTCRTLSLPLVCKTVSMFFDR
ncbi:hypothetical protein BDR06DRAFT_1047308 [Suillus hirtellus]|nr:hypothetical protein BDR06DRAFT_1047308 [Suillus hirtellus]